MVLGCSGRAGACGHVLKGLADLVVWNERGKCRECRVESMP